MPSDKPNPALLDAVKAQALKIKETKNILDARQKEVDALRAELESRAADLEKREARVEAERAEFSKEKDHVAASRAAIDKDLSTVRMDRDKAAAEERRVQDWGRTLNEREKTTKERDDQGKPIGPGMSDVPTRS